MRITYIYLKGFKRLALNAIDSLAVTITAETLLILGTNGSGKSSLLREATPFPASPTDYYEDGEKIIHCEHNGHNYELISVLKRNKHTFIKDGIILQSLVTANMQREMVIREFNYTPLVHKLLIGSVKFTDMLPTARRDLLTLISPLDLKYAISVHNSIKERIRDNQGILKHIINKKSDLNTILFELVIPDDIEKTRKDTEALLNALIPYTINNHTGNLNEIKQKIVSNYKRLDAIKQRVLKISNHRVPEDGISNLVELNTYIGNCTGRISVHQSTINELVKEIDSLSGLTNMLVDDNTFLSADDVKQQISNIKSEISKLPERSYVLSDHHEYLQTLSNLEININDIFSRIEAMPYYSSENQGLIMSQLNEFSNRRVGLLSQLDSIEKKLIHYADSNAVITCPKCKNEFDTHGISVNDAINNAQEIKAKKIKELEEVNTFILKLTESSNDVIQLRELQNSILIIKRNTYLPVYFWDDYNCTFNLRKDRTNFLNQILKWKDNIQKSLLKFDLEKELSICSNALNVINRYGDNFNTKLIQLHAAVNKELESKHHLEAKLKDAKIVLKNVTQYHALAKEGYELITDIDMLFKDAMSIIIQNDAKEHCSSLYKQLAISSEILNNKSQLESAIASLSKEHSDLLDVQNKLIILEENMSPTKGLIADQMLGFISSYVDQMNLIIGEIWEYTLSLSVCSMENGNLDYYFPLTVESEVSSDIKDGSTGQRDIIDLAFMVIMREYLGLNEYPLYLDETGASFDDAHRKVLMEYVKRLIHSGQCSQVFMVNHYTAIHGGLSNHETLVLDSRNIVTPSNHNEQVIINHRG